MSDFPREPRDRKRARMEEVISRLSREYGEPRTYLRHRTPHQLLVATILSAQCTDKRVNMVTPALFQKYPTMEDFASADVFSLAKDIHSCGYHNQKARVIKGSSLMILEEYGGEVPSTLEELVRLPGVGRKTANCVLAYVYGIPAMVVDTHMVRIMTLLGFTESQSPEKIEEEIMKLAHRKNWIVLTLLVIKHGRRVCIARRPKCGECVLRSVCPSSTV